MKVEIEDDGKGKWHSITASFMTSMSYTFEGYGQDKYDALAALELEIDGVIIELQAAMKQIEVLQGE